MREDSVCYAIYTRQSSTDTGKVLSSCEAQFSMGQDFVRVRASPGWVWIGERFDDAGVSGATTKRPALERLMQRVRAGDVEKVIVYRLDRLARSLHDCLDILETFRDAGMELLIVTSPESGSIATDNFLLNLMASFAQFERELIRSRLDDTRQALKRRGQRLAGRVPFGYEADPTTRQLVVNPDEARSVEAMFQMAADGVLPREIAETANGLGWRTKVTVAKRSGRQTGGGPWTPRHVLHLLSNPVYLGEFAEGEGGTRHGCHQAYAQTR